MMNFIMYSYVYVDIKVSAHDPFPQYKSSGMLKVKRFESQIKK